MRLRYTLIVRRAAVIAILLVGVGCSRHDSGIISGGGGKRAEPASSGRVLEGRGFGNVEDLRDRMVQMQGKGEGCSPWSYFQRFHQLEQSAYRAMDEKYADHPDFVGVCVPGVSDPEVCSDIEFTAGRELLELVRSQGGFDLLLEAQGCPSMVPCFGDATALMDVTLLLDARTAAKLRVSSLYVALDERDDAELEAAFGQALLCADAASWMPTVLARRIHTANEELVFLSLHRALVSDRLPAGMAGRLRECLRSRREGPLEFVVLGELAIMRLMLEEIKQIPEAELRQTAEAIDDFFAEFGFATAAEADPEHQPPPISPEEALARLEQAASEWTTRVNQARQDRAPRASADSPDGSTLLPQYVPLYYEFLMQRTLDEEDRLAALQRGLMLALALQEWRQESGAYPEQLEALLAGSLHRLPVDPFSGRNFRYRRCGGGYVLYSVGRDGEDNGGVFKDDAPVQWMLPRESGLDFPIIIMESIVAELLRSGADTA